MKTLYIVRHAKSPKDLEGIQDWQRPLKDTGIQRAMIVSKILNQKKIRPEKIISSHAFRALNTAVIFALNMGYPAEKIEITGNLYEKTAGDILELIKKQDDSTSSLMIFGHNPSFTDLYNVLSDKRELELPTSSVACVCFDTPSWSKIGAKKGTSLFVETGR